MYYGQDMYFNLHHTFVDVRPVYRYFKAFKDTMSEKNVSTYRYCEDTLRKKYLDTDTFKILSEKNIKIQILLRYSQEKISKYRYF